MTDEAVVSIPSAVSTAREQGSGAPRERMRNVRWGCAPVGDPSFSRIQRRCSARLSFTDLIVTEAVGQYKEQRLLFEQ